MLTYLLLTRAGGSCQLCLFLNTQAGTVSSTQVILNKHTLACVFHGTNVSRQSNTMTSL